MTSDKENIWGPKDDEYSLEFTIDWNIRIEEFP